MEVRLQSSDGTTRSVQVQAMEPLLLSSSSSALSMIENHPHQRHHRYAPPSSTVGSTDTATVVPSSSAPPTVNTANIPAAVQREKRNGDPAREEYVNPRKRARSTSPTPPAIREQLAAGNADRMWVAAAAVGSRVAGGRTTHSDGKTLLVGPTEYQGDDEGEESSESEEEEDEEEEELPPGDRVAYIHVGEGGEADLEAQLKGNLQLHTSSAATV